MKVLFQMPYPGYLRIYGSTVRALAERGHRVCLAYDSEKRREPTAAVIEATNGVEVVEPVATDRDAPWAAIVTYLRIGGDYLRYLDPRFEDASSIRKRMDKHLPPRLRPLARAQTLPVPATRAVLRALRWVERAIPSNGPTNRYVEALSPDCVVVTPLVTRGKGGVLQTETVKSARALGIPVGVAVTSWDHLTTKGLIREDPDRVFLWNDSQRSEAVELHGVAAAKIVVTGAQLFDQWFERQPRTTREEFLASVGLDPGLPYLLYVGSSPNITPAKRELKFVRSWVSRLRESGHPALSEAGVLIRPHPGNVPSWEDADLSELGNVAVSPRTRPSIPMDEREELHYFHSLHFAAAAVGINTSAMIEAAIAGCPVLTVRAGEFAKTQEGTLHFRHLVTTGEACAQVADDLDQHVRQLGDVLRERSRTQGQLEAFLRSFVRPAGLDRPATPILVDAIEQLARVPTRPRRIPVRLLPLTVLLKLTARLAGAARSRTGMGGDFTHAIPRSDLYRLIWKRYKAMARSIVGTARGRARRDQGMVSGIYEDHYSATNERYARSRDKRRDVFFVNRRPVYTDGWFTIKFHADILAAVLCELEDVSSALEVGSGRGTNIAQLALRRPDLVLTGLELTENGVERSTELVQGLPPQHLQVAGYRALVAEHTEALHRARFHRGSALSMPFDDKSFDASFTCLVLEQLTHDFERVLQEMRRVTRRYCVFIEPFAEANNPVGRAYLRSLDYFRASYRSFARHGLEPIHFTSAIPQKVHFRTGLLVARVTESPVIAMPGAYAHEPSSVQPTASIRQSASTRRTV